MTRLVKRSVNLDVIHKQSKQKMSEKILSWVLSNKFISAVFITLLTKIHPAFAQKDIFGVATSKHSSLTRSLLTLIILVVIPLACVLACFKKLWIFCCIFYSLSIYILAVLILFFTFAGLPMNLAQNIIRFVILLIPLLFLLLTICRQYRNKKIKKKEFKKKMQVLKLTVGLALLVLIIAMCWSGYQYHFERSSSGKKITGQHS